MPVPPADPTLPRPPARAPGGRTLALLVVGVLLLVPLLAPLPVRPAAAAVAAPEGAWPLAPRPAVVGGFDPPADPWGSGHRGVDLAGYTGQPVRAALAGTVTTATVIAGRGVLVVDHGPTRTTYEPVAALVPAGTRVGRGEVVGRLEAAGSHCAPAACLHWGWRRGETYLDPLDLVGAAPVRLLPLGGPAPVAGRPAGAPGDRSVPRRAALPAPAPASDGRAGAVRAVARAVPAVLAALREVGLGS